MTIIFNKIRNSHKFKVPQDIPINRVRPLKKVSTFHIFHLTEHVTI